MILLLLDKVEPTGDPRFIPLLEAWQQVDYKKVRQRIQGVIAHIRQRQAGALQPSAGDAEALSPSAAVRE